MLSEFLKRRMSIGIDVKNICYEENAKEICVTKIDFNKVISEVFQKKVSTNCILINLEKDTERYKNTISELQKISIEKFHHLKGTNGKDVDMLKADLNDVLQYLKVDQIDIDFFGDTSDPNIAIQGGPLGCYTSHLRAMIYGYLNFSDYTLIVEDDISITNTNFIEKSLKSLANNNWDIVFFNASVKEPNQPLVYADYYWGNQLEKLTEPFHSAHFYIVKNSSIPKILSKMYPIHDQVDVLFSDARNDLNIYNVHSCVYQKNIETRTQNNLSIIFNSENYEVMRVAIDEIKTNLRFFTNLILFDNEKHNESILNELMYDVLFSYITRSSKSHVYHENEEDYNFDCSPFEKYEEFKHLNDSIHFLIKFCKKGINSEKESYALAYKMIFILQSFKFHKKHSLPTYENGCSVMLGSSLNAFAFGSTSQIYIEKDRIIKFYNQKLRYVSNNHDNPKEILKKEKEIIARLAHYDWSIKFSDSTNCKNEDLPFIITQWAGTSLYDFWKLPTDWRKQITKIFSDLYDSGIYYSEFNLKNILIDHKDQIKLIDYGMAEFVDYDDYKMANKNQDMCTLYLRSLEILDQKLSSLEDSNKRHLLIYNFMENWSSK